MSSFVLAQGSLPADDVVRELDRELPGTQAAPLDLSAPPPGSGVLLIWLAADASPAVLAEIVAWASGHGLIACGADPEAALAAGFDDAVVGPLSTRELAARVRAVHRRVHRTTPARLRYGAVVIDADTHAMWVDGEPHTLTAMELSVMRALVRARGRTLSRGDLLDAAWGDGDLDVSERAVDNVILRLRRKLSRPDVIQTVRGVGFRLSDE
ncbi:MAG TPA: response regulator transcription factor [Kofleriaceae bacterium]|nr:response regulator transcription factor [Kofleriaceae bacterium]